MTCHRRCTFAFATAWTLVAIALLLIELFTPYMYVKSDAAHGLMYKCTAASDPSNLPSQIEKNVCKLSFTPNAATICALISFAIITIFLIYSTVVWFKLCCIAESWPMFFIILVRVGIALNILALIANVITTGLVASQKQSGYTFSYSFYALGIADGLILVIIIMLIAMLCCRTRDKDERPRSRKGSTQQPTYAQPIFYGQFQPVGTMPPAGGYYAGQTPPQPAYDVPGNNFNNTFPSNSRFANWNTDGSEPLYRWLYLFTRSTVFGSKK
ncbi:hypothetical protein AAHC03_013574 [Spirometra sp. Aus1]|nr:unnamed protein product [Spirometra erinaceieuropaei]